MSTEEDILEIVEQGFSETLQKARREIYRLQALEFASKKQRKPVETIAAIKYILTYKGKIKLIKPQQNGLLETVKDYLQVEEGTVDLNYKILDSKKNLIYKNTNKG